MYEVLIIGAGPAGMTAAIYAARAGYKTAVLEHGVPGGQAATTDMIENYPGFPEGISGPELMMKFFEQTQTFGVEMIYEQVQSVELNSTIKRVITDKQTIEAKAVVNRFRRQAQSIRCSQRRTSARSGRFLLRYLRRLFL